MTRFLSSSWSILQWIGIFSPHNSSKWTLRALNVYRITIFIVIGSITTLMTIQMIVATDLAILTRTIDIWTMFFSGLYKWFYMTVYDEQFSELRMALVRIQSQGSTAHGQQARLFTADYLKLVRKFTFWYLFSGVFAGFLIILNPLMTYSRNGRSNLEYYNDPKSYPLSCWIPFTLNEDWMFISIYICHSIALMIVVLMYLGIDSYMFGAIYSIGGQLELLNSSIKNIKNTLATDFVDTKSLCINNEWMSFTEEQQNQCYSILRECVKHHIHILCYIRDIRKQFSSLIIVDYVHGMTSLSFALLQLSNSVGISEVISVIFFIWVSASHQFLNNFFGELIIQKQLSVGLTLYNVQWWRANKKIRYVLTLMIMRSLKPNFITGFYMYKLCNESFLKFVKALYTYYMVLRRVNAKDINV